MGGLLHTRAYCCNLGLDVSEKLLEQADQREKNLTACFEGRTQLRGGQQVVATEPFLTENGLGIAVIQPRRQSAYGFGVLTTSVNRRCRRSSWDYS